MDLKGSIIRHSTCTEKWHPVTHLKGNSHSSSSKTSTPEGRDLVFILRLTQKVLL